MRSRTVWPMVSNTCAKLPPTSFWMLMAMTTQPKSSLAVRSAIPSRASRISHAGTTNRCGLRVRWFIPLTSKVPSPLPYTAP